VRVRFVASASPVALSGGGRVRSYWPAQALREAGWDAEASTMWPRESDVLVVHRPVSRDTLARLKRYECRVLIDVDDELDRVPRQNTWHPRQQVLDHHRATIEAADGLVVTSDRLKQVYGPLAKETWVVRNYVLGQVNPDAFPGVEDGQVRVGWAGLTKTHRQDIEWLAPQSEEAFRGAMFTTVGDIRTPAVLGLERGKYEVAPAVGLPGRFYKAMARADIGIVPLDNGENRDFNTSKSWLKAAEYIALGKPVVATDLPEQRKLLSGTRAGFLASTPQEMAEQIQALVHDSSLREQMTQAARELGRSLTLEKHIHEWVAPLKTRSEVSV
jgi:glycosyltransferase involved in cell wall biosynthesis